MRYSDIKYNLPVVEKEVSATVGTTADEITLLNKIECLKVVNPNEEKNVLVSFDDESTWFTVLPATQREFSKGYESLHIKGSAADTIYEISYLERQ